MIWPKQAREIKQAKRRAAREKAMSEAVKAAAAKQEAMKKMAAAAKSSPMAIAPSGFTGPTTPIYSPIAYSSAVQAVSLPSAPVVASNVILDKGLSIEPIVGLRSFHLNVHEMQIVSYNETVWPHREPLHAYCSSDVFADHDAPGIDCHCGIYAWADTEDIKKGGVLGSLWGEVYLWGDVLICPRGYRAESAYPKSLTLRARKMTRVITRVRDGLEEAYGVPVTIELETFEEIDTTGFGRTNPFLRS